MSSCSNAQSTDVGYLSNQTPLLAIANLAECSQSPLGPPEDEDEDEDVDFNPSLKETPSPEASSSLSSEIEGLDADVVDSKGNSFASNGINSSELTCEGQGSAVGDSELGEEEIVMQTVVSPGRTCEKESGKKVPEKLKKRKSVLTPEIGPVREKDGGSSSGTDVFNDVVAGELSSTIHSRNPIMDFDDEDAICMRTRARYSLASFTLDELETFLQETDDDDDLQNVDDEEEYRKFLAAVLQGGDGDGQTNQENENVDDEDEANDADFEIEIEEALESDIDERTRDKTQKDEYEGAGRRPETRQNRRQKASAKNKKKFLQLAKRPLRPLLPIMPNAPIAPFAALDGRNLMPETTTHRLSSSAEDGFVNGFTPHQIGQLYCLIHEHVQLLIQVFSLCALEPSRQQIASQVQGLISEMLDKHDQILAWRRFPYPGFCFRPPYIHPSVPNELPKICPAQFILEPSPAPDAQRDCSSSKMPPSYNISPSKGRYEYVSNGQTGSFQTNDGFLWVPFISGPVPSILDVAPLNLVGRYMDDVKIAEREYRRRHVEANCDTRFEREPLFPLPSFSSFAEASGEVLRGSIPPSADMMPPSSRSHQPPKKTLAATLVESSKKQSVALVPKEVVKLAQKFFPLFNSALFPHKPPPVAVANRVLFTDAEDELLAMGLMEYNTDWKAIQQRFLPCKSKHQIFVRQKNRCSSKAPENPIKAIRRMKTSPLTADEQARIQEGLRVFKLDWMSIWKFIVPHRDPSLLPRQWRIALGTQKSYKIDAAKKEKRRLYELKRRKCKSADLASWQTVSEKEDCQTENAGGEISGDDSLDNEDEAYVHEAFLADWRPGTSSLSSSERHCSNLGERNLPSDILSQDSTHVQEQPNNYGSGESQPQNNYLEFPAALRNSQHPYTLSHLTHVRHCASNTLEPDHSAPDLTLKSSKSPFCSRPYRFRRTNSAHLVKLAPDLPPVNLPPSVRVISQSAFKSYQCGASAKAAVAGGGISGAVIENAVPKLPHVAKFGTDHSMNARRNKSSLKHDITNSRLGESRVVKDKCVTEERGTESDLQMHPLLFQAPEDGCLPYYPLNCSTSTSSSFSLFSGNQSQANLSLFLNPHQAKHSFTCSHKSLKSKETTSTSCGIDFHPLLQRTDDVNSDLVAAYSTAHLSVDSDSFRGKFAQLRSSFDAVQTESQVDSGPSATGTKPSSSNEKANELDLEIHLSSASRKEKAMGSRDVTEYNPMRSTISALDSRTTMESQNTNGIYHRHIELCPTVNSKLVSDAPASVIPSNNINGYSMDNMGDQSLPEIVMEQEELSDSDEEIGEGVEFECEEMADSEGEEGSDCEQIVDERNKEASNFAVEKVSTDMDCDDQQCEHRTDSNSQGNVYISKKGSAVSLKLGLTGQGKDITSSSSWLSLDSCAPDCPPHAKPKRVGSTNGEGPAAKNWASCRPNRSCKKKTPSTKRATATAQKHTMDMPQQLSLGSLAVAPLRKPRKRVSRANLNLNTGINIESSSCVGNDKFR